MIHLHYWPTSNGNKVSIFLEEAGLAYEAHPVRIAKGDQKAPEFRKLSPNGKIPAIVDTAPADGGESVAMFESGAILLYLAEKSGQFLPKDLRRRKAALEWLFWTVSGIGPTAGQRNHYRPLEGETYSKDRFDKEMSRLVGVLDAHLQGRTFIADEYSIADIALYPVFYSAQSNNGETFDAHPNVSRWLAAISTRPAVQRAIEKGKALRSAS